MADERTKGRESERVTDRLSSRPGGASWNDERSWWRENFRMRPYVEEGRDFEHYEPGYRYGYDSADRLRGRSWSEAEPELRAGWAGYEHRGRSTWDEIRDSVRDAWHHLTGEDDEHGRHSR